MAVMAAEDRRIVVITGAAGAIGTLIVRRLGGRWRIRATDRRADSSAEELDVADAAGCREAFAGADAVVHLAANPEPDATWDELRAANVDGAYTVTTAAAEAGIRRLVLASSLHTVSAISSERQHRGDDAPRPANLYGATKAWAEALGSWIAATSSTSVVALRIGYFLPRPPTGDQASPTNLSSWLSHDDCVRLIQAAVESERDGFVVVNGISANRRRIAELGGNEASIGYAPRDDAWAWPNGDEL
jgi:nucleoside-diphosphate-sugar epimerase